MALTVVYHAALLLFAVSSVAGMWALRDPAPSRVKTLRAIVGAAAAAVLLFLALDTAARGGAPLAGLFRSLLGVTFLFAAGGLAADIFLRIPALSLAASLTGVASLAGALALAPSPGSARTDLFANHWIGLHVACMLVAYAAFVLGALAGALYLFAATSLKRKRRLDLVESLPSLETLDLLERRSVLTGFILLTVGLVVGYLVRRDETARATEWRMDPKVVWTGVTWVAYLVVIAARRLPRLRGRRGAWLAVLGLFFVLFTYFGVRTGFHVYDAEPPRTPAPHGGP
jgi:ABC-type uncharacterized transport system permease subunit